MWVRIPPDLLGARRILHPAEELPDNAQPLGWDDACTDRLWEAKVAMRLPPLTRRTRNQSMGKIGLIWPRLLLWAAVAVLGLLASHPALAQDNVHIVARGENLSTIANRYGLNLQELAPTTALSIPIWSSWASRLPCRAVARPPQSLAPATGALPGVAGYYTVVGGDTLSEVAKRHGMTHRRPAAPQRAQQRQPHLGRDKSCASRRGWPRWRRLPETRTPPRPRPQTSMWCVQATPWPRSPPPTRPPYSNCWSPTGCPTPTSSMWANGSGSRAACPRTRSPRWPPQQTVAAGSR